MDPVEPLPPARAAEAGGAAQAAACGEVAGAAGTGTATPTAAATDDPWRALRRFTAARIGLGRAGVSLPTARHLEFQLAHARARDAVHAPLDAQAVEAALRALGLDVVVLHSAAPDRATYLQRPDLGRRLDDASRERLRGLDARSVGAGAMPADAAGEESTGADATSANAADAGAAGADAAGTAAAAHAPQARRFDIAFAVVDGLSALAVERHAAALLQRVLPLLARQGRTVAPVALVRQGRVAVGDEVGERLGARLVVVLIGERPGLSSPDSLGLYLTWAPRRGLTDAARNCISNVRPQGLAYEPAAHRLAWLLDEAFSRGLSGVALKDETGPAGTAITASTNFLLPGG